VSTPAGSSQGVSRAGGREDGGAVQTPTCRGIDAWPEDADDLRRTAEVLGRITRDTHDNDSGVSLDLLVRQAVRLVPSADGASVTTLSRGTFRTVASTSPTVVEVDRLQYEHGSGPCVDAVLEDGIFMTGDVAGEPRWHPFGERVHERFGITSMLALRLHLLDESDTIAGLNLSSTRPDAFTEADVDRARLLATHCALLVTATQTRGTAVDLFEVLRANRQIGIALGVLMARRQLTRDQAFDVLRYVTQNSSRTLQDVAAEVADNGADLDVDRRVDSGGAGAPRVWAPEGRVDR
jgi:ANTAR domain/GAF domain